MNRTLPERTFICGFMGAGKSTIGSALAKQLEQPFHDLDSYIEARADQTIAAIFEAEGEDGFRREERSALLDLIRSTKGVIALGGGTLQNQHLTDHLKVNGLLVFIDTPLDMIMSRIAEDKNRPMLLDEKGNMKTEKVLKEELRHLRDQRLPLYEQAEVTISGAEFSALDNLVNHLLKKIKYHVALH
jgi:shikimate kinase